MSKFIDDFKKEIAKYDDGNIFFIAEYQNGRLEIEELTQTNPCQDIYSISKAYIVTAVGLLVDRGLLQTDETVTDILADELPSSYNKVWEKTTVDMLMLHKVGLPRGYLDIDMYDSSEFGMDYLAYALNGPIRDDFDLEESTYTDAAFYILSRIVEKRAGMGTDNFLWKYLFYPTGCREAAWSHCPMGHVLGATGLYIRVEDLIKLGIIYSNKGIYEGKRILSEEWVETVLSRGYELKPQNPGLGLAYGKGGMWGQMLLVIPENNRVAAWLGYTEREFTEYAANYRD